MQLCPDAAEIESEIIETARSGHCAVWIRNTVAEAIEAYERLRALLGEQVDLFHARFTLADRIEIENRVLASFGSTSQADTRAGRVLIATQVVEQSLDVDFDLMVSDLAPIDLVLQRAGRLHRHDRGDRGCPRLIIYSPLPDHSAEQSWVMEHSVGTGLVYPDHGRLWLGVRLLQEREDISLPEDARSLVEQVYSSDAVNAMPDTLADVHQRAQAQQAVAGATGQLNALSVTGSYEVDGTNWWRDVYTPTRLGEPSATLALAEIAKGTIRPLNHGRFPWAMSSVSVRASMLDNPVINPEILEAAKEIDAGKWRVLLPLHKVDDSWVGAVERRHQKISVCYSRTRGLLFERQAD